jgi:ABC-type bacteriocin/lantibiotic exporter with double-glycine peptidase domain
MVDVRNLIGYVGQRMFLFNDSVENNVIYPYQKVAHSAVVTACIAAHAHEFIIKLKDGYDSLVGENGNLLSGGQKQRLTIARALLKDPEILIFDEATSALDGESEKMIQRTIQELRGKKTIIVITHRPSLLECVDRVVHVHNGMIQEVGKISNPGYLQRVQE